MYLALRLVSDVAGKHPSRGQQEEETLADDLETDNAGDRLGERQHDAEHDLRPHVEAGVCRVIQQVDDPRDDGCDAKSEGRPVGDVAGAAPHAEAPLEQEAHASGRRDVQ